MSTLDDIWGLFGSSVGRSEASIDKGRKGFQLIFNGIEKSRVKEIIENLKQVNSSQNLFDQIADVYAADKSSITITLNIKPNRQDELITYLQNQGVKLLTDEPYRTADEKGREVMAWSKDLANGLLVDLKNLHPFIKDSNYLVNNLERLEDNHVKALAQNGPDDAQTSPEYAAVTSSLKKFVSDAKNHVTHERGQNILAAIEDRIIDHTREEEMVITAKYAIRD